ncbi:MAG TPA: hypothetical protein VGD74_06090 [Vulgatibacter sp.]
MKYELTKFFEVEGPYCGNDSFGLIERLAREDILAAVKAVLEANGFRVVRSSTDLRLDLSRAALGKAGEGS